MIFIDGSYEQEGETHKATVFFDDSSSVDLMLNDEAVRVMEDFLDSQFEYCCCVLQDSRKLYIRNSKISEVLVSR